MCLGNMEVEKRVRRVKGSEKEGFRSAHRAEKSNNGKATDTLSTLCWNPQGGTHLAPQIA